MADLDDVYEQFLVIDGQFERLCAAWLVFRGQPNDHSSAEYDAAVIENLSHLHTSAEPVIRTLGAMFEHVNAYGPRLESVLVRILDGEPNMFTGVMCGSYRDVWTELREELVLSVASERGVERSAEGHS